MAVAERKIPSEGTVLLRCPSCGGLREISARWARDGGGRPCVECARGHVVTVAAFYDFWRERFNEQELREMGRHIWG